MIIRSGVCDWAIFYPFDFILFCLLLAENCSWFGLKK